MTMKKNMTKTMILSLLLLIMIGLAGCNVNNDQVPENMPEENTAEPANNVTQGKRVYFAAPLFNIMEMEYNLKLANILESFGYEVFLPQRDGFLATELEGLTEEELTKKIFEKDIEEIAKSDIIFMVIDGRVPDEGACVELGIAYASGKRCYGIKSDARTIEASLATNPMIIGCLKKLFFNYDEEKLIEELKEYLENNEL